MSTTRKIKTYIRYPAIVRIIRNAYIHIYKISKANRGAVTLRKEVKRLKYNKTVTLHYA